MKKNTESIPVEITRYSDEKLTEFRQNILRKLEKALQDLKDLTGMTTNEHGTDETARSFEVVEKAAIMFANDQNALFVNRLIKLIRDLQLALIRTEDKSYGICRITHQLIPEGRLNSVPHTTTTFLAKVTEKARDKKPNGRYDEEQDLEG